MVKKKRMNLFQFENFKCIEIKYLNILSMELKVMR